MEVSPEQASLPEEQGAPGASAPQPAQPQPLATPEPQAISPFVKDRQRSGLAASISSLCVTVVIAVFVITFVVQAFQIPSESMENTLLIGDYLLVDKVHYGQGGVWGEMLPYSPLRRGDVIVFRYPVRPAEHFVKRVIGLPGDHLRLVDKQVFINGKPLNEPYVVHRSGRQDAYRDEFPNGRGAGGGDVQARWWSQMRQFVHGGELVVPLGMYFAMGDNRDESLDSRYWGFVPRENIVGRPLVIYWSMDQAILENAGFTDRLVRLGYFIAHLPQEARWNRALRLVK